MPAPLKARLLPEPIRITTRSGCFRPAPRTRITVTGVTARTAPGIKEALTELFPDASCAWKRGVIHGISVGQTFDLNVYEGAEAYALTVTDSGVGITAGDAAGLYYALQTLRQARNDDGSFPCMAVQDAPRLAIRGVMLDLGRQAEKFSRVKELIRQLSCYKINLVNIYIEANLKYTKHPELAPAWGYTPAQMKQLAAWAKKYYVQLVPAVASLGHAENYLRHPGYRKLGEDGSCYQLNPSLAGTKKLLKDMYAEWAGITDAAYFNICCDESPHLGEDTTNRALAKRIGKDGIFAKHVDFLRRLAALQNKKTMMWGDMLLHYPRLVGRIPKDTIILDWCYGDLRTEKRLSTENFRKKGYPVVVVPAATRSGQLSIPAWFQFQQNIPRFIQLKYPLGLAGAITSMWEMFTNHLATTWPGLLAAAEYSWNIDKVAIPAFKKKAGTMLFGPAGSRVMDIFNVLDGEMFHDRKRIEKTYHESAEYIPTHPFLHITGTRPHAWIRTLERRADKALAMIADIKNEITRGHDILEYVELAAMQWRILAWKRTVPNRAAALCADAANASAAERKKRLREAVTQLETFLKETRRTHAATVRLWNRARYAQDTNLRVFFLDFYETLEASLSHEIRNIKTALRKTGVPVPSVSGLPVIRIHAHNHSTVHVNILEQIISTGDDGKTWKTVTAPFRTLLWAGRDYDMLYAPSDRHLPQFMKIGIGRTHVDWDFREYPDDIVVSILETAPGAEKSDIVFENMDYRLKQHDTASYRVAARRKTELVLEKR